MLSSLGNPPSGTERRSPMYPASFEYVAPATLEEALETLGRYEDDAKVLAGGQSLIPLMKLRFAAPRVVVDINRLPGLDTLAADDGGLRIGALVRHKTCEKSEVLGGRWGTLGAAAPLISDPIIRNLGTVAGSLAHADPQGDWGSALLAMDAEVVARGPDGTRTIGLGELFEGPFVTSLQPTEAIAEAARLAAEAAQPYSDTRGSADYKRTVVRVFTERGLRTVREGAR